MPTHPIQVVTFDADGTIWDFQTTMREALAVSLESIKTIYPEETGDLTINDMIAHRQEAEEAFRRESMTMEALRFAGFMRTLDAVGIRDEYFARDLARDYLQRRYTNARIFDDALPALDMLKSHFKLGLLTNGNSYPDKLGLHDRFDFEVVAQDHGVWKPEPEFYDLAIEMAGAEPGQMLHVGDSIENDCIPARRAGMRVVWINRRGEEPPRSRQSLATIHSLVELPSFLGVQSS